MNRPKAYIILHVGLPAFSHYTPEVPVNLNDFDAILLDLDGTIYHEEHALPGAVELIRRLQRQNKLFACLTNSTSSPARLAARLKRMGVELAETSIYTAGVAAVEYVLHNASNRVPRIYNLSTEGVHDLLDGKVHWVESPTDPCDLVLVGTPTSVFAAEERQRTALAILRAQPSAKLVGICADRVFPSPRGIEFGSGALTAMLAYAAGVSPVFTGKPEAVFFRTLCARLHVEPSCCVLIGDNLESDIAGGKRLGMKTILTLTGVARREDLESLPADQRPDAVVDDLTRL